MIIENVSIKSFGKLTGRIFDFTSGVNVIRGDNESGKSTLCGFIKFMFYGFSGLTAERDRYVSWSSSACAGTLTLIEGDTRYRIEREYILSGGSGSSQSRERLAVYNTATGEKLQGVDNPGEYFFGVPEKVFAATAFIGQLGDGKVGGKELSNAASNILFSADENVSIRSALKKLDERRVTLLYKNGKGGLIFNTRAEIDKVNAELVASKADSERVTSLSQQIEELRKKRDESVSRLEKVKAGLDEYEGFVIRKLKLSLEESKRKRDAVREKLSTGFPGPEPADRAKNTESTLRDFDTASGECSILRSRLDSSRAELRRLSGSPASEKLIRYTKSVQFVDTLRRQAKARTHGKPLLICSLILFFLNIAAILLSFFGIIPVNPLYLLPSAVLFAGFAAVCAAGIVRSNRYFAKLCSDFDIKNENDLIAFAFSSKHSGDMISFMSGEIEKLASALKACEEKLALITTHTLVLIDAAGLDTVNCDVREALSAALDIFNSRAEQKRRLTADEARYSSSVSEKLELLRRYGNDEINLAIKRDYDSEKLEKFDYAEEKRKREFLSASIPALSERISALECELAALEATVKNPVELSDRLSALTLTLEEQLIEYDACILAINSIEEASANLRASVSPRISDGAGKILSGVSDGKYRSLTLDPEFSLSYQDENGVTRSVDSFSAGTADAAYLALRISLADVLFTKSVPTFVFDESFVHFDLERLSNAIKLILGVFSENQCLIFTCHDREERAIASLGAGSRVRIVRI